MCDLERDRHRSRSKQKQKSNDKKHSRRKRSSSNSSLSVSSSSSSTSSRSSVKMLKVLEDRRIQECLERKRLRESLKSKETPEEKRARRLREKEAKDLRRRQRMGWDTEYQHYTNQDNPFGDSNLMSSFVWSKKLEKEGLTDMSLETVEVRSRRKQLENKIELDKVKKRRVERELERQEREDEVIMQQRSREAAQFEEWEKQEDLFHLNQARLRSVIRIKDGRAKPIDLLAQYMSNSKLEDAIEMQMHEPYLLLNGLKIKDLEDLLIDINVYIELEKGNNSEFWSDMTTIVEDELQKLKKLKSDGQETIVCGRREGIHQSVVKDVSDIFRGKSSAELDELRCRIEMKINSHQDGVDISYWESLFLQLKAHIARARLRDQHQTRLQQKLMLLKTEIETKEEPVPTPSNDPEHKDIRQFDDNIDNNSLIGQEHQDIANNTLDIYTDLYETSNYSPRYISPNEVEDTVHIITDSEDVENIERMRAELITKLNEENSVSLEELKMRCEARKGMTTDESEFSLETPLDNTLQLSSDKYRPRKPRYFNRVHTGFEWNKYNQTHYDMDNPPPKIVQGYKFNIFYPDLIDKSTTPQYILGQCEDNSDFAVLRFHAGPPYEDIAFKIVNREWEFSYKRGFRCQFHNNIFQLWFHFKRYRYRR